MGTNDSTMYASKRAAVPNSVTTKNAGAMITASRANTGQPGVRFAIAPIAIPDGTPTNEPMNSNAMKAGAPPCSRTAMPSAITAVLARPSKAPYMRAVICE